jgi:AcrR family transcriptional regulator
VAPDDLLARLSLAFRDVGFEAASMAVLSERTGLKRASLYHRFPNGKAQMAAEVLSSAHAWLTGEVIAPLRSDAPPPERINAMVAALDAFYEGGTRACLLNMLAAPPEPGSPFADAIRTSFEDWIAALAHCAREAGASDPEARAIRAVATVQGALVLSRGLGDTAPFRTALADLPGIVFGDGA